MFKIILKIVGALLLISTAGFFMGPKVHFDQVNNTPSSIKFDISEVENYISDKEARVQNLKKDNGAKIVWADSTKSKTEYSIVYLHGFTASHGEGYPMHINVAESIGANLYLPRLPEHGVQGMDVMKNLSPQMLVEASKEAIAIGKSLGEKVVVVGCSTGGTLAIYLAAGDPSLEALVLLSPNIALRSNGASLMTGPWGQQLAYQLIGEYRDMSNTQSSKEYWTYQHHTNGLIALQELIDQTMTDDIFSAIEMPVYCGYYYKNEEVQDRAVSVEAMLEFQKVIQSPSDHVEFEAFAEGDHVLGSVYKNDNWQKVQNEVLDFLDRELIK